MALWAFQEESSWEPSDIYPNVSHSRNALPVVRWFED
jgi:hypothetical protein